VTDTDMLPQEEQRLRAMLDALQGVASELAYEVKNNLLTEAPPDASEWFDHLTRLTDAAEILSEWDPDDPAPEDGYEILFTTCDNCDRLVQPVINGTADLLCQRCEE
jgi:hypothetical protein